MKEKEKLYKECCNIVAQQHQTIIQTIVSHQKALNSETKSSAGDKHETGRAMLQLEMEKAGQQLAAIQQMKATLAKVDYTKTAALIRLGTLVETNIGTYFISISVGRLKITQQEVYAISASSPIGKVLLGKKEGDLLYWNDREIKVQKIS
jgi:transcription elongation GreA/GreB family factor